MSAALVIGEDVSRGDILSEAHDLKDRAFMLGGSCFENVTEEELEMAIELYEQAAEKFALLGDAHMHVRVCQHAVENCRERIWAERARRAVKGGGR